MPSLPQFGVCYDRSFPASEIVNFARAAEQAGLDSLYVIEDSFYDAGVPLAAAALAATEQLEVGLGVMPSVTRAAGLIAMSIATLSNVGSAANEGSETDRCRFVPGIGHGVASWMEQMGVRPSSPLTALDEVISDVKRLLNGEEVTRRGRFVHLDRVQLDQPPNPAPPVLAGVQGPRSLELAGRVADGIILVEGVGANYVNWALEYAQRSADDFRVVTYTICVVDDDREVAYRAIAPFVADSVAKQTTAMRQLDCFDELAGRVASGGAEALVDLPPAIWSEFGAIGTIEDATTHVRQLQGVGVHTVCLFPGPMLSLGYNAIEVAAQLRDRLG